jgi:hypothetical protein
MSGEASVTKSKTWLRKSLRVLWLGAISLVALYFVVRLGWRFSGPNQWEFVGEKNGVKVYTLKEPGTDLLQVKGIIRVRSTLAGLVKMNQDTDFCNEMGCIDAHIIEREDDQVQYSYFRMNLPFPYRPREFVARTRTYQNPQTKEVVMDVSAAADKIPPNSCCFRVTEINNTIRFTPVGDGHVDLEYVQHLNEGGFLPDWMLNSGRQELMFSELPKLQHYLDREKYQSAKFDFIKE